MCTLEHPLRVMGTIKKWERIPIRWICVPFWLSVNADVNHGCTSELSSDQKRSASSIALLVAKIFWMFLNVFFPSEGFRCRLFCPCPTIGDVEFGMRLVEGTKRGEFLTNKSIWIKMTNSMEIVVDIENKDLFLFLSLLFITLPDPSYSSSGLCFCPCCPDPIPSEHRPIEILYWRTTDGGSEVTLEGILSGRCHNVLFVAVFREPAVDGWHSLLLNYSSFYRCPLIETGSKKWHSK